MNFEENVNNIYKKCNTRLFFLRKLGSFQVDVKIMELFYSSVIQSMLEFCIICWFGSTTVASKQKLSKIVKAGQKTGINVLSLTKLFNNKTVKKVEKVRRDTTHPLHHYYELLRSGKRLRSIRSRTSRYCNSFIPASVRVWNNIMS